MKNTRKKLIIWDFDGVIADTECIWMEIRRQMLNKRFGLNWDLATTNHHIGGMSWRTRVETLQKMGFDVDEKFEDEAAVQDFQKLEEGFNLTSGIEKIFNRQDIKQCIATGGTPLKTAKKLKAVKLTERFPDNTVFVAEMVKHGKPAPDLFLFSAEKMGEKAEDCVVIEDSLAGLKAAQNAKMEVIAFVGGKMNNNDEYISKVKELGIKNIFRTMDEVYDFLFS